MTIHLPRFKDLDGTPRRLAPCVWWFEDLELLNGGIRVDGYADIQIDSCGEWYLHGATLGSWIIPLRPIGPRRFVSETLEINDTDPLYELLRKALVAKHSDAITEVCTMAGES